MSVRRAVRTLSLIGLALAAGGCATSTGRSVFPHQTQVLAPEAINAILERAPLRVDEDLHAETLLVTPEFSAHLLQYRVSERRHIHRAHDLTYIVYRGQGDVYIDDYRHPARPGDVFHSPRGTPHSCDNTGSDPLVAVLIFTPPYDLKDSIPVARGTRSYERAEP